MASAPGRSGRRLPSGHRLDFFAEQDRVSKDDVVGLWTTEAELMPQEAERRLSELLLIATGPGGDLAGISTTYLQPNPQLQAELWHTRVFVAAAHRQSLVAAELARMARDHLVERFVTGADARGIGVLFEVESEILKRFVPQAVWPRTQFVFIGENARGDHVRVFYFPGALAPEPDAAAPAPPD
jgi:hypothetical protein